MKGSVLLPDKIFVLIIISVPCNLQVQKLRAEIWKLSAGFVLTDLDFIRVVMFKTEFQTCFKCEKSRGRHRPYGDVLNVLSNIFVLNMFFFATLNFIIERNQESLDPAYSIRVEEEGHRNYYRYLKMSSR